MICLTDKIYYTLTDRHLIMAKWGEGDPRWIVEERPDATNVNNWHWTEKNADAWSKAKFKVSSTTDLFGMLKG